MLLFIKKKDNVWIFVFLLVRIPQRQDSYNVTDILSHTVVVFLANIYQK